MGARFYRWASIKGVVLLACALVLLPQGAQAQQREDALNKDASGTPAYFVEVRDALKSTLSARGLNPGKQAFNFVILYNATVPLSAGYGKEKEVIAGMLRRFLVQDDHISLVPYQLWVREDHAAWNESPTADSVQQMYKQIPDKAEQRDGIDGGHDLDAALLAALDKTRAAGLLDNTVFLALADGQVSDTPKRPVGYKMANAEPELSKADVVKAYEKPTYWNYGSGDSSQYSVVCRIYVPQNLKSIKSIVTPEGTGKHPAADGAATPRDESVASMWSGQSADASPKPTDTPETKNPALAPRKPDGDYNGLAAVAGVVALIGGVGGYLAWLFKPRTLNVGVNSMRAATLTFNRPLYLGAADNPKSNIIEIDSLPPSVAANEKIARLELTLLGAIRLCGERWHADKEPITIQPKMPKILLSRSQNGAKSPAGQNTAMLGGGDKISVQVTQTK